jgi:hypothetical protein
MLYGVLHAANYCVLHMQYGVHHAASSIDDLDDFQVFECH